MFIESCSQKLWLFGEGDMWGNDRKGMELGYRMTGEAEFFFSI